MSYGEVLVDKGALYIRVTLYCGYLDYIMTVSFGCILYCVCFNLHCGGFIMFCNVCVCVCVCVVCVCVCRFCNVCVFWLYIQGVPVGRDKTSGECSLC